MTELVFSSNSRSRVERLTKTKVLLSLSLFLSTEITVLNVLSTESGVEPFLVWQTAVSDKTKGRSPSHNVVRHVEKQRDSLN